MERGISSWLIGSVVALGMSISPATFASDNTNSSPDQIISALRAHVAHSLQLDSSAVTIRILSSLDRLTIRPGASINHVGSRRPVGRVTFVVGSARITADVEAVKEVLVASRFLRHNQVLEGADLTLASIRVAWADARYLAKPEQAVGKRVTRTVPLHFPVTQDVLADPYTIRKGARISIQYVSGALKVLALGIAKEDGPLGASIRVTNMDSKKDLWAKIVDGETVRVGQ
jgi:flagella basal body P-ring formation protein FlgA